LDQGTESRDGVSDRIRDSAFENDVAKTNITAIFNQHGFNNIRSL
jgi:hypothetical protein